MATGIEWTDETWNCVTGCDRVSPGCSHCYIERTIPFRMEGRKFDENGKMGIRLHPDRLDKPLHWRKPRRVFVNSLSDLFHPDVPPGFIGEVFARMLLTPRHTYQVLTKRPQHMAAILNDPKFGLELQHTVEEFDDLPGAEWSGFFSAEQRVVDGGDLFPNVWLGTSIESDKYVFRANHLRATPAAVRFLSLEPLLGPLPSLDLTGIDWVIVGGESGPGARPMHPDWVRDIRDRCASGRVCLECGGSGDIDLGQGCDYQCPKCGGSGRRKIPFFFKQWGPFQPLDSAFAAGADDGRATHVIGHEGDDFEVRTIDDVPTYGIWTLLQLVGKKAAGRELDGRTWDEMPT